MVKIRSTTPNTGFFTNHLEKMLNAPKAEYPHPTISPSQISECMRKIVAILGGLSINDPIEPRYQRIFDNGTSVHKRYLGSKGYLVRMGIACRIYNEVTATYKDFIEVTLTDPDLILKGQPDAVVFNPEDGLKYVFELKSAKHETFAALSGPEMSHIMQAHLYMYLTNIPRAILFYECKNDQDTNEFVIQQDQAVIDYLLKRIDRIKKALADYKASGILPECENASGKYPCRCNKVVLPTPAVQQ